jgi:hypothetical protein
MRKILFPFLSVLTDEHSLSPLMLRRVFSMQGAEGDGHHGVCSHGPICQACPHSQGRMYSIGGV